MHWFESSVDVAFQRHRSKDVDLSGFVVLLKREIRVIPVSPDAPALKAGHLACNLLVGVGRSLFAQLDRGQRLTLLLAHGLEHFEFNREAMTIPARNETHLSSLHQSMLIDDVLQHLVQGVAHV